MRRVKSRLQHWPVLATPWSLLRRTKHRLFGPRPKRIYSLVLQQDVAQSPTKRALLSYLVHSFSIPRDDPRFFQHISIWRVPEIVRILNRLGYTVDVIDYRDTTFVPRRKYELFIGHGGINFEKIAQRLPSTTVKIYFSTGCYWRFHNCQEVARFTALRERRGTELSLDRFIENGEDGALLAADGVIGCGNEFTKATYADFSPVIMLNNTALLDLHYQQHAQEKDFECAKKNFLYYAGPGCVHKGLDLLLEAFLELEQDLWICTHVDRQFADVYSDALQARANIHLVGWIQPRSEEYYKVMRTCAWAILPSCSEGQAQSVVECMNQGLIPVVSPACGVDVGDYGVILDPCTVEEIARVVPVLSSYPAAQCREMGQNARRAAVRDSSEIQFNRCMIAAIQKIIDQSSQCL
jgi:glycosyltransferase involved in cell wall biosynthesis